MPAPQHYRITWEGVFGTRTAPADDWSMSVTLGPAAGGPFLVRSDLQRDVPVWSDKWVELQAGIGNNAHLTECTVSLVDAAGRTPRDAAGAYIQGKGLGTALSGTGTPSVPNQIALVVSLQSAASGPTGRGRFFIPSPVTGVLDAAGLMSTTTAEAHRTRALAFLRSINTSAAALGYGSLVVASGGSVSQGIAPALRPIVSASVGRVLDTQRRRRSELIEGKTFVQL